MWSLSLTSWEIWVMIRQKHTFWTTVGFCGVLAVAVFGPLWFWAGRTHADCNVRCYPNYCYLGKGTGTNGNYYVYDNGESCYWWWRDTNGCTSAECICANQNVPLTLHQSSSGTTVCTPIQTNAAAAYSCNDPFGQMYNDTCCGSCPIQQP